MEKQRFKNTGCLYLESIVNAYAVSELLVVDNPIWIRSGDIFVFGLTTTVKTKKKKKKKKTSKVPNPNMD